MKSVWFLVDFLWGIFSVEHWLGCKRLGSNGSPPLVSTVLFVSRTVWVDIIVFPYPFGDNVYFFRRS